eukprot:637557-Rhodomonas_salina.1
MLAVDLTATDEYLKVHFPNSSPAYTSDRECVSSLVLEDAVVQRCEAYKLKSVVFGGYVPVLDLKRRIS